jgi:hypothetical protein
MKRTTAAVAVAVALAGCGSSSDKKPAPGSSSPPVASTGPAFIGVTSGDLTNPGVHVASELSLMGRSGVGSVRAPFYWREAQPARGGPTSFAKTDPLVEAASRAHVGVLPVVIGTPAWAARHPGKPNSPPQGTATYAAFLRALVGRYGSKGSFWTEHPRVPRLPIRDWQIWNEPNHAFYWSDQPFTRDYIALLRAAGTAVHTADPGARVVLAGFAERSWELIAGLYRAGARGAFDVAAIHPYTFEVPNVLKIAHLVRAAMVRGGDARRPMMITEFGWSSGKGKVRHPFGFETTPADQAARLRELLPQFTRERHALGLERVYWESWMSSDRDVNAPFDYAGLRELGAGGNTKAKPAYDAFRTLATGIERCLGATPSAPCG